MPQQRHVNQIPVSKQQLLHGCLCKVVFFDLRKMLRIHAGDICTQHCICCIMVATTFNNSVPTRLAFSDFFFFFILWENSLSFGITVLLLPQNAIGPLSKVVCCPLHILKVSGTLSQVILRSCHQALCYYNIHATCLQVFRERRRLLRNPEKNLSCKRASLYPWASDGRFYCHILFSSFHSDDHNCVKCTVRLCKASKYFPQGLIFGPPVGFINYTKSSVSPVLTGFLS